MIYCFRQGKQKKKIRNLILFEQPNNKFDILYFNKEAYLKGEYFKNKENSALNKPIEENDSFYRISSLMMVANDSVVLNIRPIGPRYRDYDVEDTYYTNKTYLDVIQKLQSFRFDYNQMINEDISSEEFRNEIVLQKHNSFQKRNETRKYVMIFNMILIMTGFFSLRHFGKSQIDPITFVALRDKLNLYGKNHGLKNITLQCVSYKIFPFNKNIGINGFVMADKGALLRLETTLKKDEENSNYIIDVYNLKPAEKKESSQQKFEVKF